MHLLICDDDRITRLLARKLTGDRPGWTIAECANGAEALLLVGAGDVDLLILDLNMPILNGIEVLRALRTSEKFREIPVVMLSSERRQEVVAQLAALHVSGYVLKPINPETFAAVLDRVLVPGQDAAQ
jgi:two-component system, chemotaxis family, chemotaxis protein CheY